MRVFLIITLCIIGCNSNPEKTLDEYVAKAIRDSTLEYENFTKQSFLNGTGFSVARKRIHTKSNELTEEIGKSSHILQRAFDILMENGEISEEDALKSLARQQPAACNQPALNCNSGSRFQTFEGTCNNLQNQRWGSVNQAFERFIPSAYENNRDVPRGGRPTSRLPNARVVSTTIHPDSIVNHQAVTNMVPQFGQFLDHDITLTPEGNRQCCAGQSDPDCWPITIPTNDAFYSRTRTPQRCMDFTRSTSFCFATASGRREQINANTAFIDGSQIYGSSQTRASRLRAGSRGMLATHSTLRGFLPTGQQLGLQVQGDFVAGDDRINEMPALAVMHNLFLMEHNRIATWIAGNRGWNDERIYQEARKIVIAELQQVTFEEYLPLVLGDAAMNNFNLYLRQAYSSYNPNTNPTILNSFATAAYRFGHSLIPGLIQLNRPQQTQSIGSFNIADNYFVSSQVTQSSGQGYDFILGGLMQQNSQQFDPFMTEQVTNFLFRTAGNDFGSDLAARNIQRGRDHGLPSYNRFRVQCGLPAMSSWGAKPAEIRADAWSRLQSLYASPEDIDLFTGGLVEATVNGGLSGPTFNCIKSAQFNRLKFGDRFFFTHSNQVGTFNQGQMQELRKRRLGDIMCQNSQLTSTTRNVFLVPSGSNAWIPCTDASRQMRMDIMVPTN